MTNLKIVKTRVKGRNGKENDNPQIEAFRAALPCQLIFLKRAGSFSDGRVVMDSARILAMADSMVATGLVAAAMWMWNG